MKIHQCKIRKDGTICTLSITHTGLIPTKVDKPSHLDMEIELFELFSSVSSSLEDQQSYN